MTLEQGLILGVLTCTLAVFIWDRWRYDFVALTSLIVCVLLGLVGPEAAFMGFSNPAVITVAAVLVISHALASSGAVDFLAERVTRHARSQFHHLFTLCVLGAFLSAFMNNVGALALLMPVALSTARRLRYSPSLFLMPLSFSTLLGGMTTLIGTPSNLLISAFRAQASGERFLMFDFAPTGLAVTVAGLAFILLVGWRLIPPARRAQSAEDEPFEVDNYITEARVVPSSALVGLPIGQFETDRAATVIGVIRDERRLFGRLNDEGLQAHDILLLQADTPTLQRLVKEDGLELVARADADSSADGTLPSLIEAVVAPDSVVQGSSPLSLDLRRRWGVNLVAVSRQGRRFEGRLRDATLSAGDVLLLEGEAERIRDAMAELGCLPLAKRRLAFEPRRVLLPITIFGIAIAIAATGILTTAVAFAGAVIALVATKIIRPMQVYESINWPVIVLLGAMIPIGDALQATGAAALIGHSIVMASGQTGPMVLLALVLIVTMAVTPVLNNAATVVIMAPIVISMANQGGLSADGFLIAVAIGASCDFLTPFGHHNNTIVMGPGGYRFGDYWRMGLPLDLVVISTSLLAIPLIWPF